MYNKLFKLTLCLLIAGAVFALQAKAEEAKQPIVDEQLRTLIEGQKRIEQRLMVLEMVQGNMLNGFRVAVGMQNAAGQRPPSAPEMDIDMNKVYKIAVGSSPIQGNKNAKVTIVEFSEIQCPFSRRFHPLIQEILKAYPKDVNHIFKHFPLGFHPWARPGAKAILAAGEQGKYFEMLDLLFQKDLPAVGQGEAPADLSKKQEEHFIALAKELRLDVKKFLKDYKDRDAEWEKIIGDDMNVATSVNVRGTPSFFLNGKTTRVRSLQEFKTEIDVILKGQGKGQ